MESLVGPAREEIPEGLFEGPSWLLRSTVGRHDVVGLAQRGAWGCPWMGDNDTDLVRKRGQMRVTGWRKMNRGEVEGD